MAQQNGETSVRFALRYRAEDPGAAPWRLSHRVPSRRPQQSSQEFHGGRLGYQPPKPPPGKGLRFFGVVLVSASTLATTTTLLDNRIVNKHYMCWISTGSDSV